MPTYRIETHCHTSLVSPCGRLTPREIATAYADGGYAGLVVTDHLVHSLPLFRGVDSWRERVHRYFSGFRAVKEEAEPMGLVVLPGFELTFTSLRGHDFLVYGFDEATLADAGNVCEMTPASFKRLADEAGALVFQAHPFRGVEPIDPQLLHGVEIWNGNPRHDSANDLAAAFAERHGLLAIAGSDAHQTDDVCRGGIAMPVVPRTAAELVRWLIEEPQSVVPFGADEAVLRETPA